MHKTLDKLVEMRIQDWRIRMSTTFTGATKPQQDAQQQRSNAGAPSVSSVQETPELFK